HHLYIVLIRIFGSIRNQLYFPVQPSSSIRIVICSHAVVVLVHIFLVRSHFLRILISESEITDTSSVLTRTTSGGFTDFICKNGKPHTDNGIFYPLYKLAVLTVGNLSFIHIKRTDSNRFRRSILYVRKVIIRLTHYKGTPRNKGHTVR